LDLPCPQPHGLDSWMRLAASLHGLSACWVCSVLLPLTGWQRVLAGYLHQAAGAESGVSESYLVRRDDDSSSRASVSSRSSLDGGVRLSSRRAPLTTAEEVRSKNLQAGETVLGLEAWKFASIVCVFSSAFVVCGFMLQKMGAESPGNYRRVGFIVLSPKWLAGFSLILVASVLGDYWSFSLAPLSLIAPLSGVTVVLNLVMAPLVLGEQLQPWPDVPASVLIFSGSIVSTSTGAHKESLYSCDQLVRLALRPVNVGSYLLLVGLSMACALYAHRESARLEKAARQRPLNPRLADVLLPAVTAASAGSLTNVHLKAEAELIKSGAPGSCCLWGLIFVLTFAAVQLNFVNRGLQLYMQTVFLPVYSSLLVLGCTAYGAVFYQEYEELLAHDGRAFITGIALILSGIGLFTKRRPSERVSSRYGSI